MASVWVPRRMGVRWLPVTDDVKVWRDFASRQDASHWLGAPFAIDVPAEEVRVFVVVTYDGLFFSARTNAIAYYLVGAGPVFKLAPPPCAWLRHARAPSARLRGQAGAIEKIWTAKARGIADKLAPLRWIECDDGERVAVSCRGRLGNEEDLARIVDLTAELATASGLPAVTALRKLSRKRVGGRPDRWDAPREWKVELSTGLRVSIDVQDGRATSAITRNCVSGCVFEVRSGAGASSTDMRLGVPVPDLGSFSIACDGTTTRLAWATLQPDATVLAAGVDFVETLPRNPSQGPFR